MINNWYYMSVLVDELWAWGQGVTMYSVWLRSDHCGDLMTDSSIAEYMYSQLPRIARLSFEQRQTSIRSLPLLYRSNRKPGSGHCCCVECRKVKTLNKTETR